MSKSMIYLAITVGGLVGSYLPVIAFHANSLGLFSIVGGVVGSIAAVVLAYNYLS